jgi:hypothetical protein
LNFSAAAPIAVRRQAAMKQNSEQPQTLEAGMTAAPDHQMIVDGDFQRFGRRRDLARHLDIGF